jgi:hypothetical protein
MPSAAIPPTEISDIASSQLPTDCMVPYTLGERATPNTTDVFTSMEKFTSGRSLLNFRPSTYLPMWESREDKVNLIVATQAVTVHLGKKKVPPLHTLGTDPVQLRSATDPLAFATAALVARSCGARPGAGSARHGHMATEYLIERCVRPERTKGRRRMPRSSAESYICDGCF